MATTMMLPITSPAAATMSPGCSAFQSSIGEIRFGSLRISPAQQSKRLKQTRRTVVAAEYRRSGGGPGDFVAGFLLGGVVFGALGYLLAPQLNRSLDKVSSENGAALPTKPNKYLEDEGIETTRKSLSAKIDELNAAIENVSAQLKEGESMKEIEVSA
ncbi:uncharacterized protein LOC9661809 isoform X2 [Selaginella moellendorffii]|uniref:uncharacterized protein LOC9661809 isoform X2 n=1 Tax=Selaginella moellendorffii TaxID=88036 RepID=UPI000D1C51F2|nr:uncharacterized protein LOC9661809 isoform X2 [Selaginella moellendorffii]|eukprot:XP_024516007.1 uncharacterized protein LOC9661809 isoform X2 [Selaginella moellendorffii]